MIFKKRISRTIIAAIMVMCMVASPVFGLEGGAIDGAADNASNSQENPTVQSAETQEQLETIEEDMHFLYVENKEVMAPGAQDIAVGWKDDINLATDVKLIVEKPNGNKLEVTEAERTDSSVKFTMNFDSDDCGTYRIIGIRYFIGTEEQSFDFDQVKIDAEFEVKQAAENEAVIQVQSGNVDEEQASNDVQEAIETASEEMLSTQSISPKNGDYYVVALDPGHSGKDGGASNNTYGINERDTNYAIAKACKKELEKYEGVEVVITYKEGGTTDLGPRVNAAANAKADLMISLHCNAYDKTVRGGEVWYPNTTGGKDNLHNEGKALSNSILNQLEQLDVSFVNRGAQTKNSSDYRGKDYYYIIREARAKGILGVIVEHCFIDNDEDCKTFLNSPEKLEKLGIADATGIAGYLGISKMSMNEGVVIEEDGKTVVKNRFVHIGGKTYRLNENGEPIKGFWSDDPTIEKKYYFGNDGVIKSNTFIDVDGNRIYVTLRGLITKNTTISYGGYRYGFNSQGAMIKNAWAWIGCTQYFFNGSGKAYINRSSIKKKTTVYRNPGSSKAGTYKKNRKFYVMRTSGKWSQMDNGLWVKTSYTKKLNVYPTVKPSVNKRYATKMKAKYGGYTGPSTSYIKKKTYKKNKKVTVIGWYGSWAKLSTGYWVPRSKLR